MNNKLQYLIELNRVTLFYKSLNSFHGIAGRILTIRFNPNFIDMTNASHQTGI